MKEVAEYESIFSKVNIFGCIINDNRSNDFIVWIVTNLNHVVKGIESKLWITTSSMETFDRFVRISCVPVSKRRSMNSVGNFDTIDLPLIKSLTVVKFWF